MEKGQFKNGEKDGLWESFYQEGQFKSKQNYENNHLEGCSEFFHRNGLIFSRINFKKGKKDGLYEEFDENGVLRKLENYKGLLLDGFSTLFSSHGELYVRGNWSKGSKIGLFEHYRDGRLNKTLEWQDGKGTEWKDGVKIGSPIYERDEFDDEVPF